MCTFDRPPGWSAYYSYIANLEADSFVYEFTPAPSEIAAA